MISTNQKTVNTYNKIASDYSLTHFSISFWKKEFSIFKKLLPAGKIIDIGCGAGRDGVLFTDVGYKYLGIDASREMINEAKKRVISGKFEVMDFYEIKFPENTFDGFWCAASLLHIPKKRISKVLKNISKIVKKDGIGFISLKEKRGVEEGLIKEEKFGGIERYFSFYTKKEFERILNNNKFKMLSFNILKEGNTNWLCYFVSNSKD